jgi:signal transduction histidine kinase
LSVTEEELQRIVLDIHDGTVQNLFAALGQLGMLRTRLTALKSSPDHIATLTRVIELLESSLREIRDLIGAFRAPEFSELRLSELVEELAVQHETLSQTNVILEIGEPLPKLPLSAKIAFYRIVQEALSNIRRHAGVCDARVRVWSTRKRLYLEVIDHGRGFDPPPLAGRNATERHEHIGLRGMRERAELVGGTLRVASRPGAGTCVSVEIPIHDGEQAHPRRSGG